MNKPSSTHHYIPKFFIQGFTNDAGFIYVYDKQTGIIHHKQRAPKSVFFETNRNAGTINGKSFDTLESTYFKFIDDISCILIKELRTHINPIEVLNAEKIIQLRWMITNLFWRLPRNDEQYNRLYSQLEVRSGKDEQTPEQKAFFEEFKKVDLFKKLIRVDASFKSIAIDGILEKPIMADIERFDQGLLLLSDYPMVFRREPGFFSDVNQEVIFPISADRIFILIEKRDYLIRDVEFIKNLNLLIIHQAHKYVISHDLENLTGFVELYRLHRELGKPISSEIVFNHLFRR